MLTWDDLVLEGQCADSGDIYNQAPISRFDRRYKISLARRRYDCLLHHDKWIDLTTLVIKTMSQSFDESNAPIFRKISVDNGIKLGACSCRKHAHVNQIKGVLLIQLLYQF